MEGGEIVPPLAELGQATGFGRRAVPSRSRMQTLPWPSFWHAVVFDWSLYGSPVQAVVDRLADTALGLGLRAQWARSGELEARAR